MRARLAGAAERPHAGADQREEDGDQRPPRPAGCQSWNNAFGFNGKPGNYVPTLVIDQNTGAMAPVGAPRNNCLLPAALVYDPVTNPSGTRCGDADLSTAVWGTTAGIPPGSVRARQTFDNVGLQYGLKALLSGAISAEDFVTLNEKIGGLDADSNRNAARSVADAEALPIAYRAGIVSSGANLGKLPIIDSRGFDEQGIHYIWRSFSERARIDDRVRQSRQPGDVALRHRPAARDGRAGGGRDAEVVPHHGRVAQQPADDRRPRRRSTTCARTRRSSRPSRPRRSTCAS
jgi:hypothetical protein